MKREEGVDTVVEQFDVAIVGYGPVGQALAALLGRAGHRVGVFERHGEIYRMPRAVHLDHEIMRLLQSLGVSDELAGEMLPVREYRWFGADREPLLTLASPAPASSGWEPDYMFFQPALEEALDRVADSQGGVTVERGWVAENLVNSGEGIELTLRHVLEDVDGRPSDAGELRRIRAGWLIGADGANSFVREAGAIGWRDLGFQERWLVVDAEPHDMSALAELPIACQWCDPERPTTHIQSGPRHRRWEFMLLPGESATELGDRARVWELLAPWYRPADGPLTRSTVYEFRSMLAERMTERRVVLAGDAAHLTPPFLGQGLCSGLRDAANIAWKLDLVLRGVAEETLMDTVDPERQPHNEWVINVAIQLGKVLCELDREAAAERDAALRQADQPPPLELPPLSGGLLHRTPDGSADPLAGRLSVQGLVALDGREGRSDDLLGTGFTLISLEDEPLESLQAEDRAILEALSVKVASLDHTAAGGARDLDGRLTAWLTENGVQAVLVRPDFYVFGSAATPRELSALLEDLGDQLGLQVLQENRDQGAPTMSKTTAVIHPKFHHFNLKTTRLQEMIDWYGALVGAEVIFQDAVGAWLSNDEANHRIALLAFPGFADDPDKETRTGIHHSAFEYAGFEELNASYLRLRGEGIEPEICIDHGMTLSYYYKDPDGNHVELQCDVFGDWASSREWMRTSPDFHTNPIGVFVQPELVAEAAEGASFAEIHRRAMTGEFSPAVAPVDIPAEA
jgi:2-polyprenyl-6-methoxyphenol hydroxylase-like FAD-dependent oxidoreductase/catechol 2,3-dioxygenase-like lactoylglutathione lyase family enzyme